MNREDNDLEEELNMVKRIVNHLYKKYNLQQINEMISREDIYHYGIIGLLDAKRKYDPQKGACFQAYAPIRIRGEIISALRKFPLVRLPQKKQNQVRLMKNTINELASENLAPSLKNIQERLGWSYSQILSVEKLMMTFFSTDDNSKNQDLKSDREFSNPEVAMLKTEIKKVMERCMKSLKNKGEMDIKGIFIARERKNVTLKQLAQQNGCSIQTICNKHNQAKQQLRSCLEEHGFDPGEK